MFLRLCSDKNIVLVRMQTSITISMQLCSIVKKKKKNVIFSFPYILIQWAYLVTDTSDILISRKPLPKATQLPSPTFINSIFSLESELWPQVYALYLKGFELRKEFRDLIILVTVGPYFTGSNRNSCKLTIKNCQLCILSINYLKIAQIVGRILDFRAFVHFKSTN